jgi:hypothetical protein
MFATALKKEVHQTLAEGGTINFLDKRVLVENLCFMYHTMRASAALLAFAAEVAEGDLRRYYLAHLAEEVGHDEWLLQDLTDNRISPFPCPSEAAALAGSQYYHIAHTSPVALLGYLLVMEGFPFPLSLIEELEAQHGKTLLRTLRFHAEHDGEHYKELAALIDNLPLPEKVVVRQVALEAAVRLGQVKAQLQKK